jgi:hypothetical protein
MTLRTSFLALCGFLAFGAAGAQTIPDYLVHRTPTARDDGPIGSTRTIGDYIQAGYTITLHTRIEGRFEGCRKHEQVNFVDKTRFECNQDAFREEMSPQVYYIENKITGSHLLFIGDHSYVGRILRKKGIKLSRVIHVGDRLIGIPTKDPDERRSIGPVDEPNGKLVPLAKSRSLWAGSVLELSALPSNPPPASVSLNPSDWDSKRRAAAVGLAHPQ